MHTCLQRLRVEQNSSGLMKPGLDTDATEDLYIKEEWKILVLKRRFRGKKSHFMVILEDQLLS